MKYKHIHTNNSNDNKNNSGNFKNSVVCVRDFFTQIDKCKTEKNIDQMQFTARFSQVNWHINYTKTF